MTRYVVNEGHKVHAGARVYLPGEDVPEGIADEAMVAVGAVSAVAEAEPATKAASRRKAVK